MVSALLLEAEIETQRKGAPIMWTIIMQPGFANAIVDFTGVLSPLLVGLGGLMALSVLFIVSFWFSVLLFV